jgi:anti-anti-sigma regulatory factor
MIATPPQATTPSSPTLDITRQVMGRTLVLTLQGVADTACIDDLEDQLARAGDLRPQHVVLDLSHLGDVSDLIRATICAFANNIRRNGGSVRYLMQPLRHSA